MLTKRRAASGVTLIELMIVVVVVGILAAVAYPSYREHVNNSRRADGKSALLNVAQRLERCFTQYNAYDHASCPVAFPVTSPDGFYQINDQSRDATTFEVRAAPQGVQAGDRCGTFTLTHTGARDVQGAALTAQQCW